MLEGAARANQVPGAQLAVFENGDTRAYTFGEAEHRGGVALTADDKLPIGSITKTFTAALAMVLVSDGDLDLDDPVADYLPELRRLSSGSPAGLTTRHLLSHTGGLTAECPGLPAGRAGWSRWVRGVQAPGTGFSYSNLGYALAGRLVEAVTGVPWTAAVRDILLKPLGITPAFVVGDSPEQYVPGHAVNLATRRVRRVTQALEPVEAPAGALALSATDLVTFARLLLRPALGGTADGLVAPAELAEMCRPVPHAEPFGLADGWGLGVALFGAGWVGHDGTADGTSCQLRVDLNTGTAVALTTNASSGNGVWPHVVDELGAGDYTAPTRTAHRVPPPRGCAGIYYNGDIEYAVFVEGDVIRLVVDDEPAARLVPHEGLMFSVVDLNTGETARPGRFLRNSGAEIDRIQIGGRVARRQHRAREVA
nr:beta-lactamase [uncultured bacterium]